MTHPQDRDPPVALTRVAPMNPAELATDRTREAATLAIARQPGFDLAAVDEQEFEAGLVRLRTRQARMAKILNTVLVAGAHYGNPNKAFNKPRLLKAGAEELATLFRLSVRLMVEPVTTTAADYVAVTVRLGVYDSRGHFLTERTGHCNSLEKRFARKNGAGYTWRDAREALHDCHTMAEKRAFVALVLAATGADAFFSAEEAMEQALTAEGDRQAETAKKAAEGPAATKEELRELYTLAHQVGIETRYDFTAFVEAAIGKRFIDAADVPAVRKALEDHARTKGASTTPAPATARDYDDPDAPINEEAGDAAE